MANCFDDNVEAIQRAIKNAGRPVKGLEPQIRALAGVINTLDKVNEKINDLEELTVWEETKYGQKLVAHPYFKIQKDAQDAVSRQMKALGLTYEMLQGSKEDDPMARTIEKVRKESNKRTGKKP